MTDAAVYTIDEFVEHYRITRTKAYKEIAAGRLRIIKYGRNTRIRKADAEAWLAAFEPVETRTAGDSELRV